MEVIYLAFMIGSRSDLPQCEEGMKYLAPFIEVGRVKFVIFFVDSIHRHHDMTIFNTEWLAANERVTHLIVGAGMANHLTGCVDAYLRYKLKNDQIVVYGVAFEGQSPDDIDAAIKSISKVPGTQVVFDTSRPTFLDACKRVLEEEPQQIVLKDAPQSEEFTSYAAVMRAIEEEKEKQAAKVK